MEDDKTILETYMCGFNNELDVKERISDLSPLLLKAYNLGALHAIVGDDVRSVDYLLDTKILDMIKSSDASIRYNKARVYSSKIVKAILDECELNGTYKKELKKMEDEIEHNVNKRNYKLIKIQITMKKEHNLQTAETQAFNIPVVMRSYKAGMMQGFRVLQSCMTFQQQKDFGFTDNDGKINERLENEWQRWLKDNYA